MTQLRAFKQVDVFTSSPYNGNPLAVIMEASDLSDEQMQTIARWTHLSETTFVLPATDPAADYRVRIFTPDYELPFAGHPTLGTAHALLEAGITLKNAGEIVQQCGLGRVKVKISDDGALAFAAPEAILTPFSDAPISSALNSDSLEEQLPVTIADMGIRWLLVPMTSADAVLAIKPDAVELARLIKKARVNGVMPFGPIQGAEEQYEVRGLLIEQGAVTEDPVTGSANACLARYFQQRGVELDYRVRQGTAMQRAGRLSVSYGADGIWIGGQTVTVIDGTIRI
ncbi:PhzF family phenazine biosynthesis protein [Erwinia aphidicola]|jgi:PhzF family phenazine biosynthesis protein|uniref:PhzF family phenazine biosynthesis protein n=1 Tax=Erwinia aphidicola TaxID=68334 RepID=A0ABU8DJC0_ERWAP|nr:PhzF family phenazine biosynthesis protein [Erwinia aphidicola]KMV73113.1 phenazine biosynthesis protein PhzF family [bacteria symbiont BFo1 of Frankliniella occidentalis]PIJ57321.1 phenazine biosynthesis protein PhzF family [Erwinia sp. OLMDLW33]KYP82806.1 phenazine biosynthesis protein PhzF family [bacteria symbiont BFo1 of Frankliniella occidentalis]KYP92565.1 phenazine biosynthesis protein PhzF family [bacteria symbiont BFo1 of Frankliniella occidentalis]MBN1083840.1 PhzF family phenazi